uniref:ANK_REP_REGION domain-containing protein n=1 Tax=Rhodnius prolixus TaxID=13249 RepID=T1H9E5_RHOPR
MTGHPTREKYGATALMYACQQGKGVEVLHIIHTKPGATTERERTLKTALHYCAESGEGGVVAASALLSAAPELINVKDQDGYSALHLAVIAGNLSLAKLLLSQGADVNSADNEGHTPAHWATVCGEIASLEYLLSHGGEANIGDVHGGCPLHYAAQMCGPASDMPADRRLGMASLRILLENGADPNRPDSHGRPPILWAASAGSSEAILVLVNTGANVAAADKDGLTALHCAASRGHTDCVETLISLCNAEVDVIDNNGCSALFYAVTLGHADATQCLLNHGANTSRQDRKGRTAMHCGAAKGQLETLRVVASWGGNMWQRTVRGDYPLHDAVSSGRRALVLWLLSERPDAVNAPNNDGKCPLHFAAIHNNIEMCKALLDAGSLVNPVMKTSRGLLATPLDTALHKGHRGCAKYLQLHGGVPASRLNSESAVLRGLTNRCGYFLHRHISQTSYGGKNMDRPAAQSETVAEAEKASKEVGIKEVKTNLGALSAPIPPAAAPPPPTQAATELTTLTCRPRILQVYVEDDVMIRRIRHHVGSDSSIEERVRRRRRKRKVKRDIKTQTSSRLKSISSGELETESTEEEVKKSKAKVNGDIKKVVLEKKDFKEFKQGRNIQIITATIHKECTGIEESDQEPKDMETTYNESVDEKINVANDVKSLVDVKLDEKIDIDEVCTPKEITALNIQKSVDNEQTEDNREAVQIENEDQSKEASSEAKASSIEDSKEDTSKISQSLEQDEDKTLTDSKFSSKEEIKEDKTTSNEVTEEATEQAEQKVIQEEQEVKEDSVEDELKSEEIKKDETKEELEYDKDKEENTNKAAKEDESKQEGLIVESYEREEEITENTISEEVKQETAISVAQELEDGEKQDEIESLMNEEIESETSAITEIAQPLKQSESVTLDEETPVCENEDIGSAEISKSLGDGIEDIKTTLDDFKQKEKNEVQKTESASFEILQMPDELKPQTSDSDYSEQNTVITSHVEREYTLSEETDEKIDGGKHAQDLEENTEESLHSAMGGDSSLLPDSGIEPSPRHIHPLKRPRSKTKSRIPRACRRNQGFAKDTPVSTLSVTQAVQYSVRK